MHRKSQRAAAFGAVLVAAMATSALADIEEMAGSRALSLGAKVQGKTVTRLNTLIVEAVP